jgi:tRNA uridine 5-carbamoylmethylation protein Kti12
MEKEYVGDLILLRGVPGSGKTTLGNAILFTNQSNIQDVLSADNFFINEKEEYVFDFTKLKEAHNDCQVKCAERMRNEFSKIVVANTFTQEWEMEPYFIMAERYNYRIHTVIVENRHGSKNVHNVPEDKIEQMVKRFDVKL